MADPLSTYDRYATAFKNKAFKPVYYFYGDEHYLIYRLQSLVVNEALQPHEHDFNLSIIYGAEADAKAVISECSSYPLMAERRVVLIREFEKMDGNELFVSYTKKPNPTSIVVIASSGKGNQNPYKAMASAAESAKFQALRDRQIPAWITREVESNGYSIKPDAAQVLAQLVRGELRTLATEIQKLLSYVGERTDILAEDVLEVAGHSREFNVFELQRQIGERDFVKSAHILERMLRVTPDVKRIAMITVSVLSSYFNKLSKLAGCQKAGVPPGELAKAIGVPHYYLKEYQAALKLFSAADRERAQFALLAADQELKGGSERDDRLILGLLLRRLTGGGVRNSSSRAA